MVLAALLNELMLMLGQVLEECAVDTVKGKEFRRSVASERCSSWAAFLVDFRENSQKENESHKRK